MISRVALAAFLAVAASACSDSVGPDGGSMDRILFLSTRDGAMDGALALSNIYVMNADGSGVENLTQYPTDYGHLDVTPDGRTVIFEATRPRGGTWTTNCPQQIWTMATDGSQLKAVTTGNCSRIPKLSPNGARFAFWRGRSIYVSNIDGSAPRDVSYDLPPVGTGCTPDPQWDVRPLGWASADRVMFYRYICGQGYTYYSVDINGNGLTEIEVDGMTAYLSPDQTRIAYDRLVDWFNTTRLSIMNADGSGARTLVENAVIHDKFAYERSPWSPDGSRLYYRTSEGHHVIDVNRAEASRVADATFRGAFNGWSPRGDRIVFTVYGTATSDIYVRNADGSGVVNLTNDASSINTQAVWVPR